MQGKVQSSKRPEKTLSSYLGLILGIEVAFDNQTKQNKTKLQKTLREAKNLIPMVAT